MKSLIRISGIGKLLFIMLLPVLLLMVACGGGGGGGAAAPSSSISYTGVTTQATIDSNNADTISTKALSGGLATAAFNVGAVQRENGAQLYYLDLYMMMEEAIQQIDLGSHREAVLVGAISHETQTIKGVLGSCTFDGDMDTVTGQFTGTFNYQGYSTDGIMTVTGIVTASGTYNSGTGKFSTLSFFFDNVVATDGNKTLTFKLTLSSDSRTTPTTLTASGLMGESEGGKTYSINYTIKLTKFTTYNQFQISGRIYLPDYGYVDITNPTAVKINTAAKNPYDGVFVVTGKSGTNARMSILSSTTYKVEADTNGDGTYEWNSGTKNW